MFFFFNQLLFHNERYTFYKKKLDKNKEVEIGKKVRTN